MKQDKIQIGMIGCGHRGIVGFLETLKEIDHPDSLVALCDPNPARLNFAWERLGSEQCKRYNDIEQFLRHPGLNTVIVATPDSTHTDIVVSCFESGKNVICEKPMATTVSDCVKMLNSCDNQKFRIAFNLRYNSVMKKVKELLMADTIGNILQVESRDIVSWQHGSDYFRRWHRFMDKSGGLLVHKSTHNFDVINWWLESTPSEVYANAQKNFYLPEHQKGECCMECDAKNSCKFYTDISIDVPGQFAGIPEFYKKMYVDGKQYDGYVRDACVFHKENDVPDTYNVLVKYDSGVNLNYSAVFYAPYEDRRFYLQGTKGRLEVSQANRKIEVFDLLSSQPVEVIDIPVESGGHGGADCNLMKSLFNNDAKDFQEATAMDGYWSVAIAAQANKSIASGAPEAINPPLKNAVIKAS